MKLIKIDDYWIIIDFEKENQNNFQNKFMWNEQLKIVWRHPYIFDDSEIDTLYSYEVLYSQNPKHNLPSIIFSDEVAKELGIVEYMNFWENMPVRWVKWTKRQPDWNGSVYLQFNGKNQGLGTVFHKQLLSLDGQDTKYHVEDEKIIADYSKQQLEMLDTIYWLEQDTNYQALSDNKDKLFTLKQLKDAYKFGVLAAQETHLPFDDYIQSLTKQEYEVLVSIRENSIFVEKIL